MNKRTRQVGMIGVSSIMLLAGALPAAAAPAEPAAVKQAVYGAAMGETTKMADPTDAKVKRDEAVSLAREYVGVPEDYTVDNVNYNSVQGHYPGAFSSWNINFVKKKDERYLGNISVTIRADNGKLASFYRYTNDPDVRPAYPPKTSFADAKGKAEAFLKDIVPEEMKNIRYNTLYEEGFKTPLNGDVRYPFRWDRVVNGVTYPNNGVNVSVDGNGDVVDFSINWEYDAQFADASKAISQEKALELFKQQAKLNLAYVRPYDMNKKDVPLRIAYQFQGMALDAVTGKVPDTGMISTTEASPIAKEAGAAPAKPASQLTQDEALAAVTGSFQLPKGAKLENISYYEYNGSMQDAGGTWNMNWTVPQNGDGEQDPAKAIMPPGMYVYASVNAVTGQVQNFSVNNYSPTATIEDKDEKITFEAAKAKAIELVKKQVPQLANQLYVQAMDTSKLPDDQRKYTPNHGFNFQRIIDGVSANNEIINVGIDRKTGEVTSYYNSTTTTSYPEKKPELIDAAKAMDLWLGQYSLELQYTVTPYYGGYYPYMGKEYYGMMMNGGMNPDKAAEPYQLMYVPVPKSQYVYDLYLEAATGEWRNMSTGDKAVFGKVKANDTAGHWAENELNLMVEYNALELKDGMVNPDQAATRGEMLKMILTAMNGGYFYPMFDTAARPASFADVKAGSALFAYVETAVDRGLIERNPSGNFNPEQAMTREEMAELIVRALGYQELAKKSSLFNLSVKDAEAIHAKGHVAIVLGLGIMNPSENGTFEPDQEVSRAAAAVGFFRYLQLRAELQPRPYYY